MRPVKIFILALGIAGVIALVLIVLVSPLSPDVEPTEISVEPDQYHSIIPTPEKDVVVP